MTLYESAIHPSDARKYIMEMQERKVDWCFTSDGDVVAIFECKRALGLND